LLKHRQEHGGRSRTTLYTIDDGNVAVGDDDAVVSRLKKSIVKTLGTFPFSTKRRSPSNNQLYFSFSSAVNGGWPEVLRSDNFVSNSAKVLNRIATLLAKTLCLTFVLDPRFNCTVIWSVRTVRSRWLLRVEGMTPEYDAWIYFECEDKIPKQI
jgi:hypothetical protein